MEKNDEMVVQQPKTNIQLGDGGIQITSLDELYRFSQAVFKSELKPKAFTSIESIMIAISMGKELGLSPMKALQNIAVINGRPSIYGDTLKAMVLSSPLCKGIKEWYEGEGDDLTAWCESTRIGQEPHRTSFSVKDAKAANLWGKNSVWQSYGKRMLMMRSRSFELRDTFSDVLGGFSVYEEVQDYSPITKPQPTIDAKANAVASTLKNVVSQISKPKMEAVKEAVVMDAADVDYEDVMKQPLEVVSEVLSEIKKIDTSELEKAAKELNDSVEDPYSMESLKAMELDELKELCVSNMIDYNTFMGKNTNKKLASLIWESRNGMPFSISKVMQPNAVVKENPVAIQDAFEAEKVAPIEAKGNSSVFDSIPEVDVTGARSFPSMKALYSLLEDNLYTNDRLMVGINKCGFVFKNKEEMCKKGTKADIISVLQNC